MATHRGFGVLLFIALSVAMGTMTLVPASGAVAGIRRSQTELPTRIYPKPISLDMGDTRSGCPSLSGLNGAARPRLGQLADALRALGGPRRMAMSASDPAFWPEIRGGRFGTGAGGWPPEPHLVARLSVQRAASSGYKVLINHCGAKTVADSWIAGICTPSETTTGTQECDPGLTESVVFIDRLGHWLIVYLYP